MDVRPINVAPRTWTAPERALWGRIEAHAFEDAGVALDLTRRLARDMGWPLAFARAAIAEYKRFCFLAMVSTDGPVTPSEEVDEVWHLHLTYTRDYWEHWCGLALGRRLHHDPTEGGPAEAARYRAQYAQTLALYESWFGPPPEAFWPGTAQRFAGAPRYRHIDGRRVLVLPRPRPCALAASLLAGAVSLLGGAAAAQEVGPGTTANVLDWSGTPFLTLYVFLLAAAAAAALGLDRLARNADQAADSDGLDPVAIAYLADGRNRAADTLLLELAVAGRARIDTQEIRLDQHPGDAPDRLQPYGSLASGRYPRSQLLGIFADSGRAATIRADLVRRRLFLNRSREWTAAAATLVPMAPALALGVAKLFVGLSRDKPVGFLAVLLVVGVIATFWLLFRGGLLTSEGERLVENLRFGRARAVRAPLRSELPLAFAVLGAAALAGSDFSAYATQIAPPGGGGSGCSTGGGDGGSGCGGGGCGGCSS